MVDLGSLFTLTGVFEILLAFVVFGNFTAAYKNNQIFRVLTAMILGFGASNMLVVAWETTIKQVIQPLTGMSILTTQAAAADMIYIIPLVMGLLYLTFFSKRLIGVYRAMIVSQLALVMGAGYVSLIATPYSQALNVANVQGDPSRAFDLVFFIISMCYFIFANKLSNRQPLSGIRKISIWAITAYFGLGISSMWARFGNNLIGWTMRGIGGLGMYVGIILLLWIVYDVFKGRTQSISVAA